jgi:hypothetical protein
VILSGSYNSGEILLDPTIAIKDLNARFQVPVLSFYRSFAFLSRSANIAVALPYGYGHFEGSVVGAATRVSRSGLADSRVRLAVNLHGGPAMRLAEFAKHRERTVIGASMTMVIPTGQYDPARLINVGTNRWAFKPEVGLSQRWGPWAVDGYAGLWIFTANPKFFPGTVNREQNRIGSFEFHLGYYVRPRMWVSFDSNFWSGGNTVLNGIPNDDRARNSRMGGTVSVPITRHHSLKLSVSQGAVVRAGGDFTNITAGWQYSWLDKQE